MTFPTDLFAVSALIITDSSGTRLTSKYFNSPFKTLIAQQSFEKSLFDKSKRGANDVILLDSQIIVFKTCVDVIVYIVGSMAENELILSSILSTFIEALNIVLKTPVEKRALLDNLDLLFLTIDETISEGILLESEPSLIASRVTRPLQDGDARIGGIPLNEQSFSQAIQAARDQLAKSLLK